MKPERSDQDVGVETDTSVSSSARDNEVKPVPVWLIPIFYGVVGAFFFTPLLANVGVELSAVPSIVILEPLHSSLGLVGLILLAAGLIHRACATVLLGCIGVVLWTIAAFLRAA